MEEYSKVCTKILENYPEYLSNEEIEILKKIIKLQNYDQIDSQMFINGLLDRIWNLFLTSKDNYKEGEPFRFLTVPNFIEYLNPDELQDLYSFRCHWLEIITDDMVPSKSPLNGGFIVEIDYLNTFSSPILPCDFQESKIHFVNCQLNPQALYQISYGIGNYCPQEANMNFVSKITKLKLLKINKPLINLKQGNPLLNNEDFKYLAQTIVMHYYSSKDIPITLKERNILAKKYYTLIKNTYLKYFQKQISLEEFANLIFQKLTEEADPPQFDKNPHL